MAGKKLPALNSSSMSDISFLLLTFFLMVSSINTDQGIQRRLPPPADPTQKPPEIHKRNTFTVLVNMNDNLLINGEVGDINALKERTKEFLGNPNNSPDLPEKEDKDIPLLGKMKVSKGVISLQNDRGTSYDMYLKVQNELTAAVNELRDELSREKFSRKYVDCNEDQRNAIDKAVPAAISEAEPKNISGQTTQGGK
ncbi:MAG: biopolymer transporter ExbD [Bacteroidales bacterium]|nr:biopolymer transporter ExbD [Bacteroidales bacterium]